ncbi:hypothetical protein SB861_45470 [Paraburkholderia sp. SIMBA_049]
MAVALVACAGASLAVAGPADTGCSFTVELNVWQQLTDWLAGPPEPPIRFGSACASIAQLPAIAATLLPDTLLARCLD